MTNAYALGQAASRSAVQVDALFLFITVISLFFFFLVEGLLVYFAVRYRRRKGAEAVATSDVTSNLLLEIVWVIVPSVVVIAFFAYGYVVYRSVTTPAPGAGEINVTAQQFYYEFQHPDGRTETGQLHVPAGKPFKLIMTSRDVIHGFFIPAYRIKQDVLPGQYTHLALPPGEEGTYDIFCTQYCGVGHSTMRGKLVVMAPAAYAKWEAAAVAAAKEVLPLAGKGKALVEKSGCLGCHTTDGTAKIGPTFKDLFGRKVALEDGRTATADEDYIRESLLDPQAKIVKGFPNVMPTFKGRLSGDDISAIIAYMKTLSGEEAREKKGEAEEKEEKAAKERARRKEREGPAAAPSASEGKELVEKLGCLGCHSIDGKAGVGPTWKGLYGKKVTLEDGRTVTADDAYIRESIVDPGAKVVKGFPNAMPNFKGRLSDGDVASIAAYLKSLK